MVEPGSPEIFTMDAEKAMTEEKRKTWKAPELRQIAADLTAVAGPRFAPGDGNSGSGKSFVPPGS